MSAAITSSPANQDRPLLMHPSSSSSQPSNQRRIRTLLDLLTIDKSDGGDPMMRREGGNNSNGSKWKIIKERLGLKVIGCCGVATWPAENPSPPEDNDVDDAAVLEDVRRRPPQQEDHNNSMINNDVAVVGPTTSGMNLAAALAAERQFRAGESTGSYGVDEGVNNEEVMTPSRVSLMRLLEETTDGCDLERRRRSSSLKRDDGDDDDVMKGCDSVCCVCMERKKGAAFIPCGHTYCRVCCREVWVNRGACPLCNRRILEILDIF